MFVFEKINDGPQRKFNWRLITINVYVACELEANKCEKILLTIKSVVYVMINVAERVNKSH